MKLVNLLLGSWTGVVMLFLYLPIVILIVYSFNKSRLNVNWTGFTFQWYQKMANDEPLMEAVKTSLIIAAIVTVLSVVLGTTGAWLLHRFRFPLPRVLATLI